MSGGWTQKRQYNPPNKSLSEDAIDLTQYKAEIYLPKAYCIKEIYKKYIASCPKNHLQINIYYYITLCDICSAIFTFYSKFEEFCFNCIYNQIYFKSKVNFVISIIITFAEPAMKTLVLNLEYIKTL